MQDRTDRDRRAPYTGRFADSGAAAPARGEAPARPAQARSGATDARSRFTGEQTRIASAGAQPQRRPSGFAIPEETKRRPAPAPQSPKEEEDSEKKPRRFPLSLRKSKEEQSDKSPTKRSQVKKLSWKKKLLIALAVLLVLLGIFLLIFGRGGGTYHQLPRIERGGESAYEPEQGGETEAGNSGETGETEYLVNPDAANGDSGEVDLSQYLVTPEPGVDLSQAAAAAGAELDATSGEGGAEADAAGEDGA